MLEIVTKQWKRKGLSFISWNDRLINSVEKDIKMVEWTPFSTVQ